MFLKAIFAFSKHKMCLPKILLLHYFFFVFFFKKKEHKKSLFLTNLPYQENKTVLPTNMNLYYSNNLSL